MSLGNALSYLTILPVPYKRHVPLVRSVHYFPLVGAGMGSVLVLAFLALQAVLPDFLACASAIALLEGMTGGRHLRAVAEMADGRRTFPGAGFEPKREYHERGVAAVAAMLLVKAAGLALMRPDWQPFAMLLTPMLGRGSQALGIIFSRQRLESSRGPKDPQIRRRKIRALVFTGALLCCMALFPWQAAALLTAGYFALLVSCYRWFNQRMEGLTVQTLGAVAEFAETAFLAGCALLS